MSIEKVISIVSRIFFLSAFVLLGIALLEGASRQFGYTILRHSFQPSRLLEYAVILLIFVMTALLRQIRDGVKQG